MGAALVPLLTTAASFAINKYNTDQTEKRQRNVLNMQLQQAQQRQQQGSALVNEALNKQRASGPEAHIKSGFDAFMDQLQKTRGAATAGMAQVGDVSDRYDAGVDAANASLFDLGRQRADMLARVDAPALQRMDEGITFGRLASDLGRLEGESDVDRFLGELRMQQAGRRNAGLDAASQFLQGYGSSGGSFGFGRGASGVGGVQRQAVPIYNPGVRI